MSSTEAREESDSDNKSTKTVNFDTILKYDIGEFGPYQLRTLVFCCILSIFVGWSNHAYIFTTARTEARCKIPECDGDNPEFAPEWILNAIPGTSQTSFETCKRYVNINVTTSLNGTCPASLFDKGDTQSCEEFVYKLKDSVAYEFDLACEEWKRSFIGSSRTAGALLAQGLTGFISDKWGRRTALIFNIINTAWLGIVRYWANSYIMFSISEFIEAFLGSAGFSCAYILAIEFVGQKYRMFSVSAMHSTSSLGQVSMAAIAWQLPYWRHLTLALYIPMLTSIIYFMFMNESVRWLMSNNRFDKAEKILLKVAKINKKELSKDAITYLKQSTEEDKRQKQKEKEKREEQEWLIKVVLRHKSIMIRCLICPVWWIVMRLVSYGISINSVNLSGNKYLNYAAVQTASIPGYFMAVLAAAKFGRRVVLLGSFLSCAACQIAYIFTSQEYQTFSLVMYVVGKMCIASVSSSLYVYTAELFPTKYRHSFFAFSSLIGRLGNVFAPLTPALAVTFWENFPYALFAGCSVFAGLLVFITPETRNVKLPDTIEEAAVIGKDKA